MIILLKRIGIFGLVAIAFLFVIGPLAGKLRETETLQAARPQGGFVIATDDGELFYQIYGPSGPQVILAHGSGAWSQFWEGTVRDLVDAGYQVIAFDMPPMGFSGPAAGNDYGRVAQAERVQALIDHLGGTPILVGHSFGAGPMVEAAMRSPETIAGLVIVDGALGVGADGTNGDLPVVLKPMWLRETLVSLTATNPILTKFLLSQFVYRKDAITDRHIEILQQPLVLRGATRDLAHWVPSLLIPPVGAKSTDPFAYQSFDKPVQIIWGDKDTVTPLGQGIEMHGLFLKSDLSVLQDVGHIPHIEAPIEFNAALISALSKIPVGN